MCSYNSFYAPPTAQQAVAINTYLSLLGSSIAGLTASAIFTGSFKLNVFDAQRSSIAVSHSIALGSAILLIRSVAVRQLGRTVLDPPPTLRHAARCFM